MATIDRGKRINLDEYNTFFTEAQANQRAGKYIRRSGEISSSKAHMEYLAYIYADRTSKDYKRAKQGLQKNLRNGRRWLILIDGFVTNDGNSIPGLGLEFLLLCGPATARKMWSTSSYKEYSIDEYARYNTTKYSDPYWKALVTYIHYSHPNTLTMCGRKAWYMIDKLRDDVDFHAIALGLKQYI